MCLSFWHRVGETVKTWDIKFFVVRQTADKKAKDRIMAILKIARMGHPILNAIAKEIEAVNASCDCWHRDRRIPPADDDSRETGSVPVGGKSEFKHSQAAVVDLCFQNR